MLETFSEQLSKVVDLDTDEAFIEYARSLVKLDLINIDHLARLNI